MTPGIEEVLDHRKRKEETIVSLRQQKDNYLLPAVRGKVKDKDSKEGYAHARDYQVHLESEIRFQKTLEIFETRCSSQSNRVE